MVKALFIKSDNNFNNIIIEGHSLFNKKNSDIVCAGISSIVFGMLNALDKLNFKGNINIVSKDAKIIINNIDSSFNILMSALFWQLKTIEDLYPKNLNIEERKDYEVKI